MLTFAASLICIVIIHFLYSNSRFFDNIRVEINSIWKIQSFSIDITRKSAYFPIYSSELLLTHFQYFQYVHTWNCNANTSFPIFIIPLVKNLPPFSKNHKFFQSRNPFKQPRCFHSVKQQIRIVGKHRLLP